MSCTSCNLKYMSTEKKDTVLSSDFPWVINTILKNGKRVLLLAVSFY